eukprot:TRINITY_DN4631_c0_g1_i3.p1 TRINITY_DN4631_c0_g1~~TRINITY_DN4631_c0_g1_i3.p1  ORF type:complete len:268 (-),score=33.49 TRINITY_DN4631_c0_g1_i3:45-848(-)
MAELSPPTPGNGRANLKLSLGMASIFEDPITFEVMENAVITPCGHSFSQYSVEDWLEKHKTCPLCNSPLAKADVVPNFSLREAIQKYENLKQALSTMPSTEVSVGTSDSDTSSAGGTPGVQRFDLSNILVPSEDTTNELHFEIPKVIIEVVEASSLAEKGDIYVVVEFQDVKKQTHISKDTEPVWEESLIFNIDTDELHGAHVSVSVYRKGVLKHHFLGKTDIALSTIMSRKKMVGWFKLEKKPTGRNTTVDCGKISLRISLLGQID